MNTLMNHIDVNSYEQSNETLQVFLICQFENEEKLFIFEVFTKRDFTQSPDEIALIPFFNCIVDNEL